MQPKFQHLDEHLMCGNMSHIQNWPFPHSGCTSPLKSPYCSLDCAGLQLSLESKVWENVIWVTKQPTSSCSPDYAYKLS